MQKKVDYGLIKEALEILVKTGNWYVAAAKADISHAQCNANSAISSAQTAINSAKGIGAICRILYLNLTLTASACASKPSASAIFIIVSFILFNPFLSIIWIVDFFRK